MKKNGKRVIAIMAAAAVGTAMLAGCGKSSGSEENGKSGDKVKLTMAVWSENQGLVMNQMIDAYEKNHSNVEINTQLATWTEYWTKLEAGMTSKTAPDILWMNVLHVEEYVKAGLLKDLTDIGEKIDMKANFPQALTEAYTFDGRLYAIPKDFDTNGVFYNKELFDRAGAAYPDGEWTFEEFIEVCRKIKAADIGEGVYATACNYNAGQSNFYPTVYANGGYIFSDDYARTGYSDPKTVEGIECWTSLVKEGLSPNLQQMTDTDPQAMFEGGKLAMYFSGDYVVEEFEANENIKGKYDVARRPSFNGKRTDIINGLGFSVYEGTKHEKEALEFAQWLGGEEAQAIQGKSGSVISARNDAQKYYAEVRPELNLGIFIENLEDVVMYPHCRVSSEIGTAVSEPLQKAWTGEMTMAEAGKIIDEKTKPILEKIK